MNDLPSNDPVENSQDHIKAVIESPAYSVAPGGRITIPVKLKFSGDLAESFLLKVVGIPSGWIYVPNPVMQFNPGEEKDVAISVQPPAAPEGRAGRYRLELVLTSQLNPEYR